jgi:hypothetical protein
MRERLANVIVLNWTSTPPAVYNPYENTEHFMLFLTCDLPSAVDYHCCVMLHGRNVWINGTTKRMYLRSMLYSIKRWFFKFALRLVKILTDRFGIYLIHFQSPKTRKHYFPPKYRKKKNMVPTPPPPHPQKTKALKT